MSEEALDRSALEPYRSIGNGSMLGNLVRLFQSGAPEEVDMVAAGLSAGDPDAVRMGAHKLHGQAATVGALRVSALAAEIESRASAGSLPTPEQVAELRESAREASVLLGEAFGGGPG